MVNIPPAGVFLRDRLFGMVQETEQIISESSFRNDDKNSPVLFTLQQRHCRATRKEQLSLFSPPFVKPNRMLHADDLRRRNIGGNRNNGDATNRDAQLLVLDEQEFNASISRTEKWMCSQVLFSGKCFA